MLTVDFDRLRADPGMIVLDAGCGQGRHSMELLRLGCSVLAMDVNLPEVCHTHYLLTSVARKIEPHPFIPVRSAFVVIQGDTLCLPFEADCFDQVICSEVLEHVRDPQQAVAELARVLKPGGRLAVSVPTPFTEWAYRFGSDDYFNSPGGHVRIFTPRRLGCLLDRQGFEVVDLSFAHAFHSVYWWIRCVFGLHKESHWLIRQFRKLLTHVLFSPQLSRTERAFDHLFPKSMVFYAEKIRPLG